MRKKRTWEQLRVQYLMLFASEQEARNLKADAEVEALLFVRTRTARERVRGRFNA